MKNFQLYFSYPWVLLLIILAFAFTLIPYFRLSKRYRRTRNRITSMVLHLVVMVLAILAFAGLEFRYQIPNEKNEIILLVDVSDTENLAKEKREDFIQRVLDDCKHDGFNVGIVTFGFDQEYAVPLTNEIETVYEAYCNAQLPDTSATNIAGALEYTKTLFNNPETSKIVLITDAKETDKQMTSVVRTIAAQGTKIDVAYVGANYNQNDIQILDVEYPNNHVNQNEECTITLKVQSSIETTATFKLRDNGQFDEEKDVLTVALKPEEQTISFKHTFMGEGLHEMQFDVEASEDKDSMSENSQYTSYIYIETFNNVLIIEKQEGTSLALIEMLNAENAVPYQITVKDIAGGEVPYEVDELRKYDQIIMNNISTTLIKESLPAGFSENLESYVEDYGGGLFTVGGDVAYSRQDVYDTYGEMLPVQTIDYTPPVAVMIVIDRSGSMAEEDNYGNNMLDWAKAGAFACIDLLTERDYIGVMTLDDTESMILGMTPQTQRSRIASAINSIQEAGGGTVLTGAVERAGQALKTVDVARRHIIVITDGGVSDEPADYEDIIKQYKEDGTTLSIIGVNMSTSSMIYQNMKQAAEWGGGELYVTTADQLIHRIGDDLTAPSIKQTNYETFNPIAVDILSPLWKGVEFGTNLDRNKIDATLNGFYGVKARSGAKIVMTGDYSIPIYVQWEYGEGMVGSFMCDLQGSEWSSDFMASVSGRNFIRNVVNNLMPNESIRPSQISYNITKDNYTNQLSVFTNLQNDQYIKGELIEYVDGNEVVHSLNEATQEDAETLRDVACYVTAPLSAANDYSRCDFVIKKSGVYKIRLSLCDKDGNVLKNINGEDITEEMYQSFAYSKEYDLFTEQEGLSVHEKMEIVATRGNGAIIKDLSAPVEILEGFVTRLDKVFDPRILFMITIIVLFLGDIAIRKFKFKWPHELIREYREKKLK